MWILFTTACCGVDAGKIWAGADGDVAEVERARLGGSSAGEGERSEQTRGRPANPGAG